MRCWRRKDRERDLERELRSDLEFEAAELQENGLSADEAWYAARRAFGNTTRVKEDVRATWRWIGLEHLWSDIRFALRTLKRSPGFASTAVLSLALGIGANAAIFGLLNAVLLRSLPVQNPQELVFLGTQTSVGTDHNFYFETYRRIQHEQPFFTQLAAFSPVRLNVRVNGESEPSVEGQLVSGNYMRLLGIDAAIGRTFTADDDRLPGAHPVAMISYAYWQRRFGRSNGVVGRKILIDGSPFTIVGVTPSDFFGLEVGRSPNITVPLMMQPQVMPDAENWLGRPVNTVDWLRIVGRVKPGVTLPQASAGMRSIFTRIQKQLAAEIDPKWQTTWLKSWAGARLVLEPGGIGISDLRRQFSAPLVILLALVGLVLVIGCANIANLQLARASTRRREMAVRLAIGASRPRLIRQLLTESILLGCIGGLLAILIAYQGSEALVRFLSIGHSSISLDVSPDFRVFGFTALLSLLTGVLFGLAPALGSSKVEPGPALKDGNGGAALRQRFGKSLVVLEVVLTLVLVIGAGLFVTSLRNLNSLDPGFDRDRVLTVRLEPRGSDQKSRNAMRLQRLYLDLQEKVQAIPNVIAAGLAGTNPTSPLQPRVVRTPDGRQFRISSAQVYPRYFESIGAPILKGRDFGRFDISPGAPYVVVINETFARRAFPNENPIGKEIVCKEAQRVPMHAARQGKQLTDSSAARPIPAPVLRVLLRGESCAVIGVVRDIKYSSLREPTPSAMYQPFLQAPTGRGQMTLHVRFRGNPGSLISQLRRYVAGMDVNMPAFEIRTLAAEVDAALVRDRLLALLSSLFGALAISLAIIGVYGVVSYAANRRTKEIGVRMALGATASAVRWLILRETLGLAGLGIAIGIPVTLAFSRFIASFLYGLTPTDPIVLSAGAASVLCMALTAGYIPSRRASRLDPVVALRND